MGTDYTTEAQQLTTEELQRILSEYQAHEPEAVVAAIEALQQRGQEIPNLQELQAALNAQAEPEKQSFADKLKANLMLLVPQPNYLVTPFIFYLNLLAFIAGTILGIDMIEPDAGAMIGLGANFSPYTLSGEWWRLLTSAFLHGGIVHLAFNMLALLNIGSQLEALVGKVQFLLAYLLCALAGSVASLWWTNPGVQVSVGASGAIFGLFGMLLIILALERELDWKSKRAILANIAVVIGMNLMYGMRSGIDNAAHIGGLVGGLAFGFMLMLRSNRHIHYKFSAIGNSVSVGAVLLLLIGIISSIPFKGEARWVYTLEQVGINENEAMQAVFELDKAGDDYDAEQMLPLVANGLQLWEETEVLLEQVDDAPAEEQRKLEALLDYVRLRKLSYQMLQDDLKAGRALLHPKQQQMLGAIGSYVTMLQTNNFSSLDRQEMSEEEIQETVGMIKGSNGEPMQAEEIEAVKNPLFVLDGKELGVAPVEEAFPEVNALQPADIEKVTLLKGDEAVATYGDIAAGGAILITTTKQQAP